ncbi:TIGR04282 family arsenosugar biosynthesis glycosyltransferase [Thiohalorhabdus methylotrophus]|uniref:TIGR04282 family arsenosugar biosynthesis glycosyltransferase n=1 Tax=Thiohalorhabdus methylotrophus TaxID=3242694 RepID=A0ABV4TUP5_9GAMM
MSGAPPERLLVLAKAPVPGQVFRRLAPVLTARQAARLHMRLTAGTLQRLVDPHRWRTRLYGTPDTRHPFLRACARRHGIPLRLQHGRDLGERLHRALAEALAGGGPAVLVGTDLPRLDAESVAAAFRALREGNDAVLLPTEDGGYGLVGLRRPLPELFREIPWGSERVAEATRERLRTTGAAWRELPTTWDVDRPEDLDRLARIPDHSSSTSPRNASPSTGYPSSFHSG